MQESLCEQTKSLERLNGDRRQPLVGHKAYDNGNGCI